jgi:hypothetical protein
MLHHPSSLIPDHFLRATFDSSRNLARFLPAVFFLSIDMASSLPPNVHISKHPCLRAKLSQLRSKSRNARETKTLVHEISLLLGSEALAQLELDSTGTVSLHFLPLLSVGAD